MMLKSVIRSWTLSYTWSHNPGNKMVRCGVITVVLFYGLINLGDRFHISGNTFVAGLVIVLVFAFATLAFGCLRIVNYFRGRKADNR